MNALAFALAWGAALGRCERSPAEVERLASHFIELSTRHNFLYWLVERAIHQGWARSRSGNTANYNLSRALLHASDHNAPEIEQHHALLRKDEAILNKLNRGVNKPYKSCIRAPFEALVTRDLDGYGSLQRVSGWDKNSDHYVRASSDIIVLQASNSNNRGDD